MRKSRFAETQIIGLILEQEAGMPTAEVYRRHGLSPATFYKLKSKYGGMEVSDAYRLSKWHQRILRSLKRSCIGVCPAISIPPGKARQ